MSVWPFADPPNVVTITTKSVTSRRAWIYYVSHDEDDGCWQFLPKEGAGSEEDAAVVTLRTIAALDPMLLELADLPLGWHAWRESPTAGWRRAPKAPQED